MGKRLKKGKAPPSVHCPTMVSKKVTKQSDQSVEIADEAVVAVMKQRSCVHFDKRFNLDKLLKTMKSCQQIKCGECKEGVHVKRASIWKANSRKNGFPLSSKKAIWVCLECGYSVCGEPSEPQSHVVRHIKLTRHLLVIQCDNPKLRWCVPCNSLLSFEKEENGEKKDLLLEVVKLIKERYSNSSYASVETYDSYSGIKLQGSVSRGIEARDGYALRGLVNLGNTCFFNSVMQNLLSLDQLRDHFLKEDMSGCGGLLFSSLKRLFVETKSVVGLFMSAINPIAFFSCVCSQAPQFRGYQQHDSHELLRCLLDGLSIEESSLRDSSTHQKPTLIDSVFGGEISSTISCLECGHSSKVYEPFLDLSLPVPSKKPPPRKQETISQEKIGNIPPNPCAKPETVLNEEDARATRSNEDTAVSRISADINEAQVCGYPDLGKSSLSENLWADEELPLMVADSQLLYMPYKDGISYDDKTVADSQFLYMPYKDGVSYDDKTVADSQFLYMPYKDGVSYGDKTVAEGKGDASSSYVSGHHEQTIDYVDFSSFFDEPEISEGPVFGPSSKAEVSEAGLMAVSNNDETVRTGEGEAFSSFSDHGQKDYVDLSSSFDEHEISEGPVLGPLSKAEVSESGLMAVSTNDKTVKAGEGEAFSLSVFSDHGQNIDYADFSSFFNEPEIFQGPPSKAGFMSVISDSDTEVLDDSDSPVSLDRCLAQFTKPEILSEDNAWHCENCSKNLKLQRLREKRITKGVGNGWVNENEATLASDECRDNPSYQFFLALENGYKEEKITIDDGVLGDSDTMQPSTSSQEAEDSEEVIVKTEATKRVLINKAPSVLTIHLKRFSQDARGKLSKLSGHVDFKEFLDLSQYMDTRWTEEDQPVYRLVGLVEHKGTMRGGHYVSYIRGDKDIKEANSSIWYYASDYYVRRASFEEVLHSEAYILFYQRI